MTGRSTPAAALLAAVGFVLVLLGIGFRAGAPAVLGLTLAALLLLSRRHARAAVAAVQARREVYPSAFEGDEVGVGLVLENHGRDALHDLEMVDAFGPALADRHALLETGPFGGRRRRRLRYRTYCTRSWGVYVLGPMRAAASDPWGLYRADKPVAALDPFTIFPRVHEVAALQGLGARHSLAPQARSAARAGQGAVFLGVRDYRPGDEERRIHWPATARRGSLVVKEHELDLVPQFTLVLDLHKDQRAGTGAKSTLEYVVRTAASLLWSASARGDLVQLIAEGARPIHGPAGTGELHVTHALSEIVQCRQDGTASVFDVLDRHRALVPASSTLCLLLGRLDPDLARLQETLAWLRAAAIETLVVLVDAESFVPVGRWRRPAAAARASEQALRALLHEQGVRHVVLGAAHDLATELRRSDLLETA